jgi:hypothetical protein
MADLRQKSLSNNLYERLIDAAEIFRQRLTFFADLAEIICLELATLVKVAL